MTDPLDKGGPIQGLLGVHSLYGLHARAVTVFRDTLSRRLQPFRYLHSCSGCFRLERLPGGVCTHWRAPPCGHLRAGIFEHLVVLNIEIIIGEYSECSGLEYGLIPISPGKRTHGI